MKLEVIKDDMILKLDKLHEYFAKVYDSIKLHRADLDHVLKEMRGLSIDISLLKKQLKESEILVAKKQD